jgi:hypothetical protein
MSVRADGIVLRIPQKTADPMLLRATLDVAVQLRRALAGATAAGPFR